LTALFQAARRRHRLRRDQDRRQRNQSELDQTGKIVKEAVTATKIANGTVSSSKLGPITVQTETVADGEVAGGWRSSGFNESPTTGTSILVWVLCAA
jgi:hypothetical protein